MSNINLQSKPNIQKIHFLIHPGFLSREVPLMPENDPTRNPYKARMAEYETLLDKYLEKAKKLNPNELMFAFAHTEQPQLIEDAKEGKRYISVLRELKNILGRRLVVLSGNHDVVFDDNVFNTAKEIAEARGFYFDKDVFTEAYGEMLNICVERGTERLNTNGELNKKTLIRTDLTDTPVYGELDRIKEDMLNRSSRIEF